MAFAIAPNPSNQSNLVQVEAFKAANANTAVPPDPIYIDVGGDTFATATTIPGLPYSDTGNTSSYASNYESCVGCFTCPYSSTGARDVVYAYTAAVNTALEIDLCSSFYDTKVYVCDGTVSSVVACNDDACGTGLPGAWQSHIQNAPVLAGHTYYIVIDGYSSTDMGVYDLTVWEGIGGCLITCPPASIVENEPVCYDEYYDQFNGGCNSVPPVFTYLPCGPSGTTTTVCGTYGGFFYSGSSYRDTDWYRITLQTSASITWCVTGAYETLVGIIDGNNGCPVTSFFDYNYGGACAPTCVTDNLTPGTWWLFVGTMGFGPSIGACGGRYVATLTGYNGFPCGGIVAVEPTSWSNVKSLYR